MTSIQQVKRETIVLILIILFGLFIRLYFWSGYGDFTWDEGSHSLSGVLIARTILNGFNLDYFREFTDHYWSSVGSLFFFPWGYTILTTISYLIFGFSDLSARLPSMFFSIFSIYTIYLLANKIFNKKIGLLSAFLMAINPYFITRGGVALVDVPMTCLILLAFYFCWCGFDSKKITPWFLSGLLVGFSGLMKPTGFIIYPFLVAFILYRQGYKFIYSKSFVIFNLIIMACFTSYFGFGVLALVVFPKLGWIEPSQGQLIFKSIFQWFGRLLPEKYFDFFGQNLVHANYTDPNWRILSGWSFYVILLKAQLGSLAAIFASFIGAIVLIINKQKKEFYFIVFYIIYIYLIFTFIANKDYRYTMPLIPFMLILLAVGIDYLSYQIKVKYYSSIFMLLILTSLTYLSLYATADSRFNAIGHNLQKSTKAITYHKSGSVIPYQENNIVNVQTISFYLAINDPNLNFAVYWPETIRPSDYVVSQVESEIKGFKVGLNNHRFHLWPSILIPHKYK